MISKPQPSVKPWKTVEAADEDGKSLKDTSKPLKDSKVVDDASEPPEDVKAAGQPLEDGKWGKWADSVLDNNNFDQNSCTIFVRLGQFQCNPDYEKIIS